MSIATELQNYADGLDDAYDAVDDMSGIVPAHKNMNNLDQAIRTIPQNTGATVTTFHWGGSPNYSMYKDSGYTTAATYSDIATAYASGIVYIADGEDEVTYVVVSDIPDAYTITVTGIGLPGYEGASASYAYASSTWTKTATEFQTKLTAGTGINISAQNVISATVSGMTTFNTEQNLRETQLTHAIFKDYARTEPAYTEDLYNAATTGGAILFCDGRGADESESYYITAYYDPDDGYYEIYATSGTRVYKVEETAYHSGSYTSSYIGYKDFTGATGSAAGTAGLVPAPAAGENAEVLYGDGTWKLPGMTILKYGTSTYAEALAAYKANNIIYTRASSNASNPGTGDQLRMAFLAYVNNEANPTEFEFQYYRSVSTHSDSTQGDEVFVYKLKSSTGWEFTKRNAYSKVAVDSSLTKTYSSGTITLKANAMAGATSGTAGTAGYVPAPAAGDQNKVLLGSGTWGVPLEIYSATEQEVGVWTDGSTLYKKTLTISGTSGYVAHGVTNLGVIVKVEGTVIDMDLLGEEYIQTFPIPYYSTADGANLRCGANATNVSVASSGNFNFEDPTTYITIYYTKSS